MGCRQKIIVNVKLNCCPLFFKMFTDSFEKGILTVSLRGDMLTLLPKSGKPCNKCESLRPVSLLNVALKIHCKILARRLERFLPNLIPCDQTGFISSRQGFHNVRRVLDILHSQEGKTDTLYNHWMPKRPFIESSGPIYLKY